MTSPKCQLNRHLPSKAFPDPLVENTALVPSLFSCCRAVLKVLPVASVLGALLTGPRAETMSPPPPSTEPWSVSEGLLASHKPSQEAVNLLLLASPLQASPGVSLHCLLSQPLPGLTPRESSDLLLLLSVSLLTPWSCLAVAVALQVLGSESAISEAPSPGLLLDRCPGSHAPCLSHPHSAEERQREGRGGKRPYPARPCTSFQKLPRGTPRKLLRDSEADPNHRLCSVSFSFGPRREQTEPSPACIQLFVFKRSKRGSVRATPTPGRFALSPRRKFHWRGSPSCSAGTGCSR